MDWISTLQLRRMPKSLSRFCSQWYLAGAVSCLCKHRYQRTNYMISFHKYYSTNTKSVTLENAKFFQREIFSYNFRSKLSQRLISHDVHTSSYNYSNTHSVELIPVCKVKKGSLKVSMRFLVRFLYS